MQLKQLTVGTILLSSLASLSGCGGGSSDSDTLTPASVVNTLVCANPSAEVDVDANVVIAFFATIYQLEVGDIDPLGAFIKTSALIFELATDNSAWVDGVRVPITSACYKPLSNSLTLILGSASANNVLTLTSGKRATGTYNGKVVRTQSN